MLLLIDDANLKLIEEINNIYPCDGVTTNPSILKKQGKNPIKLLKEIRNFLPENAQLHAQVISTTPNEMLKEANHLRKNLGENTYIKVPVTEAGIEAMKLMKKEKINITATAIYSPMQAYLAAKAGAKYTAPYVNRLDNMGTDGVEIAKQIHEIFVKHDFYTDVLAASFKNSRQISELCKYGIGAVTAAPDIIKALLANEATKSAVNVFNEDFYELANGKKTMLDF